MIADGSIFSTSNTHFDLLTVHESLSSQARCLMADHKSQTLPPQNDNLAQENFVAILFE
jgi:hypothetical protein